MQPEMALIIYLSAFHVCHEYVSAALYIDIVYSWIKAAIQIGDGN